MYAIMPQTPPSFSFGRGQGNAHHRPTFSSPLSSSPVRASSLSPPPQQHSVSLPLSPCNQSTLNSLSRHHHHSQRATQSSPITPATSLFGSSVDCTPAGSSRNSTNSKFRFASRNPRPNPVLKRRDDAQEGRRRLFLQNVRQRQEDRRWEMRGGEDELLKLEWHRFNRERQQAREAELAAYQHAYLLDDDDVDVHVPPPQQFGRDDLDDVDALMADVIAQEEAAEVDALLSALEGQGAKGAQFSDDDEDYDGLFMDLIAQQQQQQQQDGQGISLSQDVEMT